MEISFLGHPVCRVRQLRVAGEVPVQRADRWHLLPCKSALMVMIHNYIISFQLFIYAAAAAAAAASATTYDGTLSVSNAQRPT